MKKQVVDSKIKAIHGRWPTWWIPDHEAYGMYQMDYMPGWLPIIERLFEQIDERLDARDRDEFRIFQIKEKFGGLRIYTEGLLHTDISDLIDEAEEAAWDACMYCGDPGKPRLTGWRLTLCERHFLMQKRDGIRMDEQYDLMTTPGERH